MRHKKYLKKSASLVLTIGTLIVRGALLLFVGIIKGCKDILHLFGPIDVY